MPAYRRTYATATACYKSRFTFKHAAHVTTMLA